MPAIADPNVLVELSTSDDAAVYRITDDIAVALTVDFFTPVVDDAYEYGRIAVTNALSDIYAMGAKPVIALNLVAYPAKTRPIDKLEDILRGGADQAAAAGVSIVGGHSIDDPEPKYGMCVMGLVNPNKIYTNAGAKVGDKLILTKPLGTGVIATAIKRDAASPEVTARAIEVMTTLNAAASEAMQKVGCNACTDVTGFGLLGHLCEMTAASKVGAKLHYDKVPLIEGVKELLEMDMAPGGTWANMEFLDSAGTVVWEGNLSENERLILCDAQTAGGLLISVPSELAGELLDKLKSTGVSSAIEIGEIIEDPEFRAHVVH